MNIKTTIKQDRNAMQILKATYFRAHLGAILDNLKKNDIIVIDRGEGVVVLPLATYTELSGRKISVTSQAEQLEIK